MTNPFVSIKRLFEDTSDDWRPSPDTRVEKNFMKYDLTAELRF